MDEQAVWVARQPAPALAALVDGYLGYRMAGFPAGVHRGLPSAHLTLIVSIGPPIDVIAQPDTGQTPRQYGAIVGGLHTSPALVAHDGSAEGVTIGLTPLGSRALFGMPAGALWSTSLELDEITGSAGRELWERLQECPGWEQRFAAVDEVLERLLRDDTLEPALGRAWKVLTASHGAAPTAEIAHSIGWTRQHFARRFAAEFGPSPKLAARLVRFERAQRMLQRTPAFVSFAQIAAICGYYDQAHLNRDFVEFAGLPPGRLIAAEDLPSFQDRGSASGAPLPS
jgi:AraC-like DNA-binding protein